MTDEDEPGGSPGWAATVPSALTDRRRGLRSAVRTAVVRVRWTTQRCRQHSTRCGPRSRTSRAGAGGQRRRHGPLVLGRPRRRQGLDRRAALASRDLGGDGGPAGAGRPAPRPHHVHRPRPGLAGHARCSPTATLPIEAARTLLFGCTLEGWRVVHVGQASADRRPTPPRWRRPAVASTATPDTPGNHVTLTACIQRSRRAEHRRPPAGRRSSRTGSSSVSSSCPFRRRRAPRRAGRRIPDTDPRGAVPPRGGGSGVASPGRRLSPCRAGCAWSARAEQSGSASSLAASAPASRHGTVHAWSAEGLRADWPS